MPYILPGPSRTLSNLSHQTGSDAVLSAAVLPAIPCSPEPEAEHAIPRRRAGWSGSLLIGAALVATFMVAGCQGKDAAKAANGHGPAGGGQMPALPVTVIKAERHAIPIQIKAPGQAEGSREVEVRARVGGILVRKLYEEGDVVKVDQPMYEIDRAPLEIALSQARAQLGQAQAQFDNARREEVRLKPLAERRAVSQREYDNAVSARRTAEAARAAVQSQIRDAELNLSYSTVRAPIAGVSGRSQQSEGTLITVASNSLLTTISTLDPIWVRFGLSEVDNRRLQSGTIDSVRIVDTTGQTLLDKGEINFSSTTIDRTLGTQQLRVTFPNPDRKVLPGQFVQVMVSIAGREAWTVPQQAVITSDQGRMVWVVGADDKVEPRPIQVAEWVGKDWVVTDGLKDGDQVVIDNLFKIRPGAGVAPHPPGQGPGAPGGGAGGASAGAAPGNGKAEGGAAGGDASTKAN